jgi:hypothetical protein
VHPAANALSAAKLIAVPSIAFWFCSWPERSGWVRRPMLAS